MNVVKNEIKRMRKQILGNINIETFAKLGTGFYKYNALVPKHEKQRAIQLRHVLSQGNLLINQRRCTKEKVFY